VRKHVVVQDDAALGVDDTAGGDAEPDRPRALPQDFAHLLLDELENLIDQGLAILRRGKRLAALPDYLSGKIGRDHAQPLGLHVEADQLPVVRIDSDRYTAWRATIFSDAFFRQQPFADHLLDQVANARVADVLG